MAGTTVFLLLLVFAVLATAKDYVLEDLIAEESGTNNRRVIHNIGDDLDQSKAKKVVQQSRVEDTIRTVQEPLTGPGYKQEPNQSAAVKDKGGGRKEEDDEDKKTLSQQVQEGRYSLLQEDIFAKIPKRPGIISYEVNPEVPKDNVNNLGGLKPEEIWLAENHLLILAGGSFDNKESNQPIWPPIDNYIAPQRQVKIPPNPKVPPPFPVQLKPGGPIEFIKNENGTGGPPPFLPPFFPLSENASFPFPSSDNGPGNLTPGNGPYLPPPFPFSPPLNGSFFLPPPRGFLPPIPPGAAFLPPPGNLTDQFDEDDPSLYYPPPYDFYYPKDNSSLVPPGPLVPGIVLPPPPDFFAPYKNTTASKARRPQTRPPFKSKPTTRKPTKHKNVHIITSTEDPYNGVKIKPSIGKVNILTTPPPLVRTTFTPPPVTTNIYTRPPSVKTTTDSSLNEITRPTIVHALPPNAVVKGWVPIPAPHPYYITSARKPLRKGTTTTIPPDYNSITPPEDQGYVYNAPDYELSINSWLYPNKSKTYDQEQQYFKTITQPPKQDFYYDDFYSDKGQFYTSTESPIGYDDQTKLKSLFYPTRSPPTTIVPPRLYGSNVGNRGKSLKTYYFYEEPHISEGQLTDAENIPQQYRGGNSHTITEEVYINTAAKQSVQGRFKPSPLDYFYPQDYSNTGAQQTTTESPLQYYYVPEHTKDFDSYPYPPSVGSTPKPRTSTKPPVYEYSFSIPGYGSLDSPKVGIAKPEEYPAKFDYQTTAKPYNEQLYTTSTPTTTASPVYRNQLRGESQYYTTQRPSIQYYTTQKPQVEQAIQTENPYHAFFTHHDAGLIDDITKKYFTTFGQKLNKDSIRGEALTTPLPPVANDPVQPYYTQTSPRPQYYENDRPRPQYQHSPPLAVSGFYTTAPPPQNYPQRVKYSRPVYSQYYDQRSQSSIVSTQKPISLSSDILVNFKEPLPPINPDAEFIDTSNPSLSKPEQSFISYRLPGNGGGHFFFLTPQVAQQSQQYSDYVYDAERTGTYYKRNVRRPQNQRKRPAVSRTS
ncbi:extensin-2-like [Homalodisca vitripennis]|uniref:extensin-2-like n=1 Tax=Homalodisca vitripennis TaxID=197043 RepID=UPI001EEC2F6F|nr:extensin-2-like [Homalodisca vitripennis]